MMADQWPRSSHQCAIDHSCCLLCSRSTSSAATFIRLCLPAVKPSCLQGSTCARLPPGSMGAFGFVVDQLKLWPSSLFPGWLIAKKKQNKTNTLIMAREGRGRADFQWTGYSATPSCVIITDQPQWRVNWGGGYKFPSHVQNGLMKHFCLMSLCAVLTCRPTHKRAHKPRLKQTFNCPFRANEPLNNTSLWSKKESFTLV